MPLIHVFHMSFACSVNASIIHAFYRHTTAMPLIHVFHMSCACSVDASIIHVFYMSILRVNYYSIRAISLCYTGICIGKWNLHALGLDHICMLFTCPSSTSQIHALYISSALACCNMTDLHVLGMQPKYMYTFTHIKHMHFLHVVNQDQNDYMSKACIFHISDTTAQIMCQKKPFWMSFQHEIQMECSCMY